MEIADNSHQKGHHQKRKWIISIAVAAVALSGAGLLSAQFIKSPAEAMAASSAPKPSVLTFPVEWRTLKDSVIVRGTVTAAQTVEVAATGAKGETTSSIVTKLPVSGGQRVESGQVLVEISGRPLVALKGILPVYRDLKPGTEGDDVAQLQLALADIGFSCSGDRPGYFGSKTKIALSKMYTSRGYKPPMARADGELSVTEVQDRVTTALRAAQDADNMVSGRSSPEHKRRIERTSEDLRNARQLLKEVSAKSGPMLPASEVVFISKPPARVDSVASRIGAKATGTILTLSSGDLLVQGYLQQSQVGLVHPGQKVEVLSEGTGKVAAGTVASVSATPTKKSESSSTADQTSPPGDIVQQGYLMAVKSTAPLDADLTGQDVRLTVQAAVAKKKAFVVPASAISSSVDGKTSISIHGTQGDSRRVSVITGASGDGYVEVRPTNGARLSVGDLVIVGAGER